MESLSFHAHAKTDSRWRRQTHTISHPVHGISVFLFFSFLTINSIALVSAQNESTVNIKPVFGTVDGYYTGGNNTVCWTSLYDRPTIVTSGEQATQLISMNNQLSRFPGLSSFQQLSSCEPGSKLTVGIINGTDRGVMWRGLRNTFEVQLEVDLSNYADVVVPGQDIIVWYRIFKCLAPQVGYCHPLLDSYRWDSYYPDPLAVTASDFAYHEEEVLDANSTDPLKNITFTTIWIADKITPKVQNNDTVSTASKDQSFIYTGGLNISTVCWKSMVQGWYHVIAHATLLLANSTGQSVRLDLSNVLPGEPLGLATKPEIKELTTPAKIFIGCLIGGAGLFTLSLFFFILHHRNHRVMTMAQSGLLMCLAAASCLTISFSFLLMPLYNIFCQLNGLLFIPGTLIPTILVGRLWRIYTTLAVAHRLGRGPIADGSSSSEGKSGAKHSSMKQRTRVHLSKVSRASENFVMKLLSWVACSACIHSWDKRRSHPSKLRSTNSLRRTTTRVETILLIFFLASPQIVVQIFGVFYFDSTVWVYYAEDNSAATMVCKSKGWVMNFGAGYLAAMFLLAMYVAWCSRNLPSAFNEKDAVFMSAFLNGLIVAITAVCLNFSNEPETPPNISVSLTVIMIVGVALITTYFVIWPKVLRVRGGEPVVVTNILRDMNGVTSSRMSSEEEEFRLASEKATATHSVDSVGTIRKKVSTELAVLQYDEAIPKTLERQLYQLNGMTASITDRW